MYDEQYTTLDAARAAGIEHDALAAMFKRHVFAGAPRQEDVTPGTGRTRLLSLRRVFQIALTCRLVDWGIPAKEAASYAMIFTDNFSAEPFVVNDQLQVPPAPTRLPGHLFADGPTYFRVRRTVAGIECTVSAQGSQAAGAYGAMDIDLTELTAGVRRSLGA